MHRIAARVVPLVLVLSVAFVGSGFGWFSPSPQKLPVTAISIDTPQGPAVFQVEVADNDKSQEIGLMYRKEMAPNAGMLFDMHKPQFVSFWMKNTYLTLDLLFVRADGTISSVEPNAIPLSLDSIRSQEPIRVVIELNGGRAHQLGIKPGARVHAAIFGNR